MAWPLISASGQRPLYASRCNAEVIYIGARPSVIYSAKRTTVLIACPYGG